MSRGGFPFTLRQIELFAGGERLTGMRNRKRTLVVFIIMLLVLPQPAQAQAPDKVSLSVKATEADAGKLPFKYWGNSFSHKFHRPSCPFARQIGSGRLTRFHFRCQAVDAGYKPCRWCLPPVWLSVHAVLLKPDSPQVHPIAALVRK